ncbi:hypothetical protein ACFVRB_26710 [Streptomyces nojiriensis]|uniref:hypothetical protein n=1 Tax=Streptomyces nojiriensis TaxID=66374 RepID=UPI0036DA78AC
MHKTTSLPEPQPPYLAVALQHIADGITYSEYAWPPRRPGPHARTRLHRHGTVNAVT